jgi:hypothetical protein
VLNLWSTTAPTRPIAVTASSTICEDAPAQEESTATTRKEGRQNLKRERWRKEERGEGREGASASLPGPRLYERPEGSAAARKRGPRRMREWEGRERDDARACGCEGVGVGEIGRRTRRPSATHLLRKPNIE